MEVTETGIILTPEETEDAVNLAKSLIGEVLYLCDDKMTFSQAFEVVSKSWDQYIIGENLLSMIDARYPERLLPDDNETESEVEFTPAPPSRT